MAQAGLDPVSGRDTATPISLLTLACLVAAGPARAQPLDARRIDSIANAEMITLGAPGAAVVVVGRGGVLFECALGVRSADTRDTMSLDAVMRVGSVTKMVTALSALVLASEGRLDIDRPVRTYVPGLARAIGALTTRQLLSHTAGLRNEGAGSGPHDDGALGTRVRGWTAAQLFTRPGDVYSYSSPGYWLAGHVIERVTRASFADAVAQLVLTPLGMTRSTFRPTEALTRPLALDHVRDSSGVRVLRPYPDDASTWPGGSLFSSARDLARLVTAIMHDGTVDGGPRLQRAAVTLLKEGQADVPGGCRYAFGLVRCVEGSDTTLSHAGFRTGTGAVVTIVPTRGVAIVALANGPGAIMRGTEQGILAQIAPTLASAEDSVPTTVDFPAAVLGRYVNGPDTLRVERNGARTTLWQAGQQYRAEYGEGGVVRVSDDAGALQQVLYVVRGRATGVPYLHDGLGAYRRLGP